MHTLKKSHTFRLKNRQSGISLIESLVALVVLALGVMGLAGVQTRLLVETRTANSRAVAVQLIDDLSNRMLLNRYAALGRPQLTAGDPRFLASSYLLAWSNTTGMTAPNPSTCLGAICTAAQLAAADMFQWRTAVNAALPGAQATVFQLPAASGDLRQIGIALGWPLNERTTNAAYNTPFNTTNNNITCPATLICHVVYVQP